MLHSGEFVLRSLTGQQRQVHEEAVAQYEVSREEATAWVKGRLGQVLEQAKASFLEALRPLREPRAPREPRPPPPAGKAARPLLDRGDCEGAWNAALTAAFWTFHRHGAVPAEMMLMIGKLAQEVDPDHLWPVTAEHLRAMGAEL